MCGIAGIIANERKERMVFDISNMLNTIIHRGDTPPSYKCIQNSVIGTNRLAIVDILEGGQPISNEKENLHIVFNGEIYNYKRLRTILETKGYTFKTNTDTEVILNGYQEYNEDIAGMLDGDFAFVILDSSDGSYFAARDCFGVKPFHYTNIDGCFIFASERKAFVKNGIFSSYEVLKPGYFIKNGLVKQYYSIPQETICADDVMLCNMIREKLNEAVRKRCDTELPIGIFLSGGVDSSIVLALAAQYKKNIKAYSIGFENSDDVFYAQKLCKDLNIEHEIYKVRESDLVDTVNETIYYTELFEPLDIKNAILTKLLAKCAKKDGLKIVLVGEGSDEIFGGYGHFLKRADKESYMYEKLNALHLTELQRVDMACMSHSIEARVPFLDKDLVECVVNIPFAQKIQYGAEKYLLRKSFEGILPDYILKRRKVAFFVGANIDQKIAQLNNFITEQAYNQYVPNEKEFAFFLDVYKSFGYPEPNQRIRN